MNLFNIHNILLLAAAYLIGSIPTALWVGKLFHGVDIRKKGSGNLGATNTIRVLGVGTGIPVLVFDIIKGFTATLLAFKFNPILQGDELVYLKLVTGFLAVIGHIIPIFAGFRGGKGIATLFGMFLGVHYGSALICLGIFIVVFLASRIVSLGSIIAAIFYPIVVYFLFGKDDPLFIAFTIIFSFLVIYTHRSNIKRLLSGKEKRLSFSRKKNEE